MHDGIERRKNKRFNHQSAILHSTSPPDFFYRGTMYNISSGGLYFESDEDILVSDEISVSIQDPPPKFSKKPREYFDVKIMWCKVQQGSNYQIGYGAMLL